MRETEGTETLLEVERTWKEETEKRQKQIMRRAVPAKRTLLNALETLTRQDLEDIRYNVGMSGTSSLHKAELIEKLVPAILDFSKSWFVSMLHEEYQAMRHIAEREGISTQFRADEMRLDYFQSLGLVFRGAYNGKPAWYMPNEVLEEFRKLNIGSLAKVAEWNSDAVRLAVGLLYYYGVLDHERLFAKVKQYMEAEDDTFQFTDFMQVMCNGACWQRNFQITERLMCYYTVVDPKRILAAQAQIGVGFAKIPYDKVYDAGEENYIESTAAYQALAQFFMRAYRRDVLTAAKVMEEITILLQNGGQMKDVLTYTDSLGEVSEKEEKELASLLMRFHNSLRLWILKGHTPEEIVSGELDPEEKETALSPSPFKKKVGRNDPCPCGSGKKYKNCCLREK